MQITIKIPKEVYENPKEKTIKEMVKELVKRGFVSSSALYLMSKKED